MCSSGSTSSSTAFSPWRSRRCSFPPALRQSRCSSHSALVASLFGVGLTTLLTHQELGDWGWRIPYFFGMLIGPAGLYVRAKVVDTPEFIEAEKPATMPISDLLRRYPLAVLLALGISIISNSSFYLLLYIPTFGVKQLHLPEYTGFVATLIGGLVPAIGCPVAGHWSDKVVPPRLMRITSGPV